MRTKRNFVCSIIFLGLLVIMASIPIGVYSQVPQTINHQGYLTDSKGKPVDGTVQILFSIYDNDTGGTALWTEARSVDVNKGVYNVNLGEVNPISILFDIQYYLGIKVGTDPEMTPRQPFTSAPYAFRADEANYSYDIADGAVTDQKITGPISGSKLGNHSHSGNDIISGTVAESYIDPLIARDSEVISAVNTHASRTDNPHQVTAAQIGAAAISHMHDTDYVNEGQPDSITNPMIVNGGVTDAKITGPISGSKISSSGLNADTVDGKHASELGVVFGDSYWTGWSSNGANLECASGYVVTGLNRQCWNDECQYGGSWFIKLKCTRLQ